MYIMIENSLITAKVLALADVQALAFRLVGKLNEVD